MSGLKLIIGAEQEGFLIVPRAYGAMITGDRRGSHSLLQRRLLGVLLVSWGEIVDSILNHVSRVHGLLQAAGDALHGGTVTLRGRGTFVTWKRPHILIKPIEPIVALERKKGVLN